MIKKFIYISLFIAIISSSMINLSVVKAERRTIVVPDDFPTIEDAIINAKEGDALFVRRGVYEEEQLKITNGLSIIGEDAKNTILNLNPPQIKVADSHSIIDSSPIWIYDYSIKVEANNFKLQGLTINSPGNILVTGNGTELTANTIASNVYVSGSSCNIAENNLLGDVGVNGSYTKVIKNTFSGSIWIYGSHMNISANNKNTSNKVGTSDSGIKLEGECSIIYGNILTAKDLEPSIRVSGDRNTIAKNFVQYADIGIVASGSNNIIYGNTVVNCLDEFFLPSLSPISGIGLRISGNNTIAGNSIENNTWGIEVNAFVEKKTSTFFKNNFIGNNHDVAAVPNVPYGNDVFDNGREGNYWSDYNGTDQNGDGIGDIPYIIDTNRSDHYPLMSPVDIDDLTVELIDKMIITTGESMTDNTQPLVTAVALTLVIVALLVGTIIYYRKHSWIPP